jgi:hypothetical protein
MKARCGIPRSSDDLEERKYGVSFAVRGLSWKRSGKKRTKGGIVWI